MKSRKIHLIIFVVSLCVFLGTESRIMDFLMGIEVGIILFCTVQIWYMQRRFSAKLELAETTITRGEEIILYFNGKNRGKIPVSHMEAEIYYEDVYSGEKKKEKLEGVVDTKGETKLQVLIKPSYCGVVRIKLGKVRVFDYLGLFCRNCKVDTGEKEVFVLPWNDSFELEEKREAEEYTGNSGEDLGEVYEIREFRNGDDIRQIHWKLTAKMDMFLMRDYVTSTGNEIFIYLDFTKELYEKAAREELDLFYDKAASLSNELLEGNISHFIGWQYEKEYTYRYVKDEESFKAYEIALVNTAICENSVDDIYIKEPVENEENLYVIRMDFKGRFYQREGTTQN
jgi:uncharacterized protein (DUF58 family)